MSEQLRAQLIDGLTTAEIMQLSMDYEASPEAFKEAGIFHARYVGDITALRQDLEELITETGKQNERQVAMRHMDELSAMGPNPDLDDAALGEAFGELISHRQALVKRQETVFGYGEDVSTTFATHMLDSLPEITAASLNGTTYEWVDGYVTTRGQTPAKHTQLNVYAGSGLCAVLAHKYIVHNTQKIRDRKEIQVRMVSPEDWLRFLNDLAVVTKF